MSSRATQQDGSITFKARRRCQPSEVSAISLSRKKSHSYVLRVPLCLAVHELSSEVLPMIVAVRGKAGAQEPICSEMTSTASVIAEIMEELSSKTQNERGEWTSESQVVQQQRWEAAWFLVAPPSTWATMT